jgi:hypothetical protein
MRQRRLNDDYIVRIYRRSAADSRLLVGTVERVGFPERRAFGSIDELWSVLNSSRRAARLRSRPLDQE